MQTITLSIPRINCHHCIMTVQRESGFVEGVKFLTGDIAGRKATFQIENEAAIESLKAALAEAGYPVEG